MTQTYFTGGRLLLLNVAIGLGTFIQVLDTSIANVAVPYIAGNLGVSADQGTWVITSFSASNAVVLPLTGWLSSYFGRVRLFVSSILLFTLMSFLCGLAISLPMLVVFRVLQGAVAGSLIPLSQSLIVVCNPPEKKGGALGFWGLVVIIAPVLGPIIGGYLTYNYSWPWIFYLNVPIGIFSALVVWVILKDQESHIVRTPIDVLGLALLAIGVGALQIMLDKGKDLDWFESPAIITLTIVSGMALLYFFIWNAFQKSPVVDFSFLKNRNFVLGTVATTVGFLLYFASTVTLPLWLQTEQNYTASWAGVAVAPIGLVPLIAMPFVGKYMGRFDLRLVIALSFFFFFLGFYYQALFTTDVTLGHIMWTRFLQGFGISIFFIPLTQLTLGQIPEERYVSASGLFNFIRILVGSGFGTSLSIELWTRREIFHHGRLTEALTHYREVVGQFYQQFRSFNPQFTTPVIDRVLDSQVEQQAFMLSTNELAALSALLFLLVIPLIFFCKRVKKTS